MKHAAEIFELAVVFVGLVALGLASISYGPAIYKAGQLVGWW